MVTEANGDDVMKGKRAGEEKWGQKQSKFKG